MLNYAVANGWLETNPFKLAGGADLDFKERVIRLRAINAKTNRKRGVPMTTRIGSHSEFGLLRT